MRWASVSQKRRHSARSWVRISLPSADAAYDVTGYVRGTITPLGSATTLPVIADASITGPISIGGGAHGVALSVDAAELLAALGATVADVTELNEPTDPPEPTDLSGASDAPPSS